MDSTNTPEEMQDTQAAEAAASDSEELKAKDAEAEAAATVSPDTPNEFGAPEEEEDWGE